jgi:PEP-CTERM motif
VLRIPFVPSDNRPVFAACAALIFGFCAAHANTIDASATGLPSPAETIDFSEIVLPADTAVTSQYSSLGVTFSPSVYYNPEVPYGTFTNDVGNFTYPTEPNFTDPVTINFTSVQTAADFQMAADTTPYQFQAYLGGTLVDSFTDTAVSPSSGLYYGFSGESFDSIVITQEGAGEPYWLIDNIQLSNLSAATVPEPSPVVLMLAGFVGIGLFGLRRRKQA